MDRLTTWQRLGIVVTIAWVAFSTFATAGRASSAVQASERSAYYQTCLAAARQASGQLTSPADYITDATFITRCSEVAAAQPVELPDEGPLLLNAFGYAALNAAVMWLIVGGIGWIIGWVRTGRRMSF